MAMRLFEVLIHLVQLSIQIHYHNVGNNKFNNEKNPDYKASLQRVFNRNSIIESSSYINGFF